MIKSNSSNALLLAAMRCMSILTNMFSSVVLARALSLEAYGTYAAGNLIIAVFTNATLLGMMDAVNYFFYQSKYDREDSINTLFFLQLVLGIISASVILMGQQSFTAYFKNPMLQGIYVYIAFSPLVGNLYSMLLILQFSIGASRRVAIRKALMAANKLASVLLTTFVTKDIRTIFIAYLLFDAITVVYFLYTFRHAAFAIRPYRFQRELIRPILIFAVPMGIYTMTNALSKDIDKLLIGRFLGAEALAIYSNCGAALPFDFITAAFLTILIPIMTRLIHNNSLNQAQQLFRAYLSIGILFTLVFTSGCMILSEEVILLLYGEEYLVGKTVFILYTLVDMVKFANIPLILSASGNTRTLMVLSIAMLGLNTVLNLFFYALVGFHGPVIATVIATLLTTLVMLFLSARILNCKFLKLFDFRLVIKLLLCIITAGFVIIPLRSLLMDMGVHYVIRLAVLGIGYCGSIILINKNEIIKNFRILNRERIA